MVLLDLYWKKLLNINGCLVKCFRDDIHVVHFACTTEVHAPTTQCVGGYAML